MNEQRPTPLEFRRAKNKAERRERLTAEAATPKVVRKVKIPSLGWCPPEESDMRELDWD